jgi:APA family basic amino acid/polyamine antiporter
MFFFKKRTKKLLLRFARVAYRSRCETDKSFLLLFFKIEGLPSCMTKPSDITAEGLRVAIGFPSAVMLVMGGIVGVGIFVNPAVVARQVHSPGLVLGAWGAGGVIALLGAFIYAELAARMPATGGEYVYLRNTYGKLAGFLFGWATLLVVQAGGQAAVAIVFARNLAVLTGSGISEGAVVIGTLAALATVNCIGVSAGNRVQTALGAVRMAAIVAIIIGGLFFATRVHSVAAAALPPPSDNVKSFAAAMIPVVFCYGGWQTASYVTGEMKNPANNLARALLVGVLAVITLYLLVNVACLRALGVAALGETATPASDVLERVAGPAGARLAAGAIALSAIAFMSQGMLTGPRVSFAMARDGLFFRSVATVSDTRHVPVIAILLQAGWTGVLALTGTYEQILSYVTAMNFLFFGLCASCLFIVRRRAAPETVLYQVPWHPWTTGAFIAACAAIVAASFWSYPVNSLIGYGILLLGLPPYLYWRHSNLKE